MLSDISQTQTDIVRCHVCGVHRAGKCRETERSWQCEILQMDSGAGCMTSEMHLIPLNHVLKNGEDGQFYPKSILQQSLLKVQRQMRPGRAGCLSRREDAKPSV